MGRVTLQTIADRVGVSRMTVSNAFSKPDQLSTALREKVLAAADELGYVGPDPAARALARGTAGAIGVLMTDSLSYAFTDEIATGFLGAVADELYPTGLAMTLLASGSGSPAGSVPARDVPMDGALVYSCGLDSVAVDWLSRRGLPLVFVDQSPRPGVSSVNVDDRGGARAAAQHVVDLGHRRVGIINRELGGHDLVAAHYAGDLHVSNQRLLGWTEPLSAAGVETTIVTEPTTPLDEPPGSPGHPEDGVAAAAGELLQRADRPTAVLCFSDVTAYRVIRAAEELGLRVPQDLSVVGFDDSPLARRMHPALTTVRQDVQEKGRAAAAALTAAIEASRSGKSPRAKRVLLPTELIVRDSTAPPPPAA